MPATRNRQALKTSTTENVKARSAAKRVTKSQSKPKNTKVKTLRESSKQNVERKQPVYDALGYEIDPAKVAACNRRPRKLSPNSYMKMIEGEQKEQDRMEEIMGTPHDQISATTLSAWQDRVARELCKPYHKVVMEDYEEVHRRGIKFHPDEFIAAKMSQQEKERISKLAIGSAFRK
jgi:hypothetical protein